MCGVKFSVNVFTIFLSATCLKNLEADSPESKFSPLNLTGQKKRLIIDTDAGADDAVAILNILTTEDLFGDIEVDLITAVSGNTNVDNVARNVLKVLKTINRLEIPLYKGANQSLLGTPNIENFFGEDGFGDFVFDNPPSEDLISNKHAVNALIEAAALNPGQLTLVCLGPLTNIALAIRLAKNFLENLKEVYILGGSVNGMGNVKPGIEFNFYVDPEAAMIVFKEAEKRKKILHLLPWETASVRSAIGMEWRKEILGVIESPQVDLINKAERLTLSGNNWISSDTILSSLVIDGTIIEAADLYHAEVELCGHHSRAALFIDYDDSTNQTKNIHIIKNINVDRFKKMLLRNFNTRRGQIRETSTIIKLKEPPE